jgi:transposase
MKKIFVGIDVSKQWIDVCVTTDVKSIWHRQFENNIRGFKAMIKWIKEFSNQLNEWLICMEHTGIYALPLWHFLTDKNISYCVVAGSVITSGLEIRRGKNDKIDACDIAKFTMRYRMN